MISSGENKLDWRSRLRGSLLRHEREDMPWSSCIWKRNRKNGYTTVSWNGIVYLGTKDKESRLVRGYHTTLAYEKETIRTAPVR